MFKLNAVSLAVAAALSAAALPAVSQQNDTKLERVVVTGSAIKRIDGEAPAPVEVVSREDIRRTGATTVNELIRTLSTVDVFDQGELSSNSPGGSGTGSVGMRGLGDTQTLVLVNGRRVPVNPLADASGAGAAFDINQLPLGAIERVEILKDGGSAIYGSDAVAGVVNFILRKDFQGVELKTGWGQSSRGDATEKQAGVAAGFGDLFKDRFNVLVALDVLKRDPIYRKDRDISKSMDFRRFGPIGSLNLDGRSSFSPYGNILNDDFAPTGETVKPCPTELVNGTCRYDPNASLLTAYNGADRVSGLIAGTVQLTDDIQAYARYMGSRSEDHFEAHPVPDYFLLPDGRYYMGRFMQGGPRITDRKNTFNNIDLGVEGTTAKLDWKLGLSHGVAKTTNRDSGYYDRAKWDDATGSGKLDATSNQNDQALVDSLKVTPVRKGTAELTALDAQVGGDWFKLPGGIVRYAAGFSAWQEKLVDAPDAQQLAGTVVGSIQQSGINRSRDAHAVFGELQLPITKTLEAQAALRYDDYGSASRSSPKFGVRWQLLPQVLIRSSYSQSFKMPTLKQLHGNPGEGAANLTAEQCVKVGMTAPCALAPYKSVTGGNADLKPETAKSYNFGAVFEQGALSTSVDYWRIDKDQNIEELDLNQAIDRGLFQRDGKGELRIFQNLQNYAQSNYSGVDVDARYKLSTAMFGKLSAKASATYYLHQRRREKAGDAWEESNGTYATPRWRTAFSLTSELGPWTTTAMVRTTSGFWDTDRHYDEFKQLAVLRKVSSHTEADLSLSYAGVKNLTLGFAIKNLFDKMPPFSVTNATDNTNSQQGFAELYTSRGRYFQLTAQYSFR
ncbi:TonB-dependent receptor [Roseateles cavernae]|uniref:TonB-dependent receptor n=1 Tax=Roseateles cavernae TaxID=3153578 RepID=UPI0032E36D96